MFTVPTLLGRSRIHGIGVFAVTSIPAGTVIWDFTPEVDWRFTPAELASFPEPFQSRLRHYTYLEATGDYVLCGDHARFMNHSEAPNCDDRGAFTVTVRDIHPGEELTCDYRAFDVEFDGGAFLPSGSTGSENGSAPDPGPSPAWPASDSGLVPPPSDVGGPLPGQGAGSVRLS